MPRAKATCLPALIFHREIHTLITHNNPSLFPFPLPPPILSSPHTPKSQTTKKRSQKKNKRKKKQPHRIRIRIKCKCPQISLSLTSKQSQSLPYNPFSSSSSNGYTPQVQALSHPVRRRRQPHPQPHRQPRHPPPPPPDPPHVPPPPPPRRSAAPPLRRRRGQSPPQTQRSLHLFSAVHPRRRR